MEILKRSFANFRPRDLEESIELEAFIKKIDIVLPPLYSAFVKSFAFSREENLISEQVFIKVHNYKSYLGHVYYLPDKEKLLIGDFFSIEESLSIRNRLYNINDDVFSKKLLPIGEDSTGHFIIMVGCGNDNQDKIFIESGDESFVAGERFTLIANDIFEFVRGFAFITRDDMDDIKYNRLYRNWGEDFWRVREDV
ncbi:SMI1/KNR4 family protein [Runella sp. MFBS21]|uniref:SMI1/KNR4 family protein n=1 Tax=Runella sp. MFBS21 TaxID=3034018 RepID=UPI0023F6F51F|nr:SMI1/KNR4 family protein [Runella sp. MFBS21]MDF7819360.1 SMI1/KNR4 family protein [Runella sp. MFBS21]